MPTASLTRSSTSSTNSVRLRSLTLPSEARLAGELVRGRDGRGVECGSCAGEPVPASHDLVRRTIKAPVPAFVAIVKKNTSADGQPRSMLVAPDPLAQLWVAARLNVTACSARRLQRCPQRQCGSPWRCACTPVPALASSTVVPIGQRTADVRAARRRRPASATPAFRPPAAAPTADGQRAEPVQLVRRRSTAARRSRRRLGGSTSKTAPNTAQPCARGRPARPHRNRSPTFATENLLIGRGRVHAPGRTLRRHAVASGRGARALRPQQATRRMPARGVPRRPGRRDVAMPRLLPPTVTAIQRCLDAQPAGQLRQLPMLAEALESSRTTVR